MRRVLLVACLLTALSAPAYAFFIAGGSAVTGGTPTNAYVAEDGTTKDVAEDGTTFYVQEN